MSEADATEDPAPAPLLALRSPTLAGQLRPLMPLIEEKLKEGVTHAQIVEALAERGIKMTVPTFRSALQRYRKKKMSEGAASHAPPETSQLDDIERPPPPPAPAPSPRLARGDASVAEQAEEDDGEKPPPRRMNSLDQARAAGAAYAPKPSLLLHKPAPKGEK